jgi:osmotically inducible protein OsmC
MALAMLRNPSRCTSGFANGSYKISPVELHTMARVPGISEEDFTKHTQTAKAECPVSQALAGTDVILKAQLES